MPSLYTNTKHEPHPFRLGRAAQMQWAREDDAEAVYARRRIVENNEHVPRPGSYARLFFDAWAGRCMEGVRR